jgi:RNase P/RNase MRP subunit p30
MKDLNLFRVGDSLCLRRVNRKVDVSGGCDGYLIEGSEKVARSIIASLGDKKFKGKIGFVGGDGSLNRRAVESLKIDYLVSPEALTGKDTLKQRDSGLNHVVAKMAKEKGILVVVDFGEIASLKGKEKARRIARVMQNVDVCRKVGCGIRIASLAGSKKDVVSELGRKAFGVTLGMSSSEIRDCVKF